MNLGARPGNKLSNKLLFAIAAAAICVAYR
jgi:hypothetical protein